MHAKIFTPRRRFALTMAITLACACLTAIGPSAHAVDAPASEAKPAAKNTRVVKPVDDESRDAPAPKAAAVKKGQDDDAPKAGVARPGRITKPAEPDTDADNKPTARRTKSSKDAKSVEREDPMDRLREKLAERLGAARAVDPREVRVTAHSPAPTPARKSAKAAAARGAKPAAKTTAGHAMHWAYEGEGGPKNWGGLKPEFTKCSTGLRQSPIDIRDGIKVQLDPVQIDYRPSAFRVIDNGHTVQVNLAPGNLIEVIGRRYELQQFHFHRPSEERINGRQFEMVAHLVHKDAEGRLAVIAVLLDRGIAHPLVQTVWNNLPLEKGEEVPAKALIDLSVLLPAERSYYTYMGSLTTPPCSEGVLWMVMKEPVTVSAEQIGVFSRLYPMNARPVQSASGRLIKESN
jgi:carbonic anhydrase